MRTILLKNTIIDESEFEPLLELGLNRYEASIYLTLVTEGEQTAKETSNMTGVPYGKIYEMVEALNSKGFVYIIPSKPLKVRAVSPKNIIEHARKSLQKRIDRFKEHSKEHLEPRYRQTSKFHDPKTAFLLMRGRSQVARKVEEFIVLSVRSIKILTTENGLKRFVAHKGVLVDAAQRGVDIHISAPLTSQNSEDVTSLSFCKIAHTPLRTMDLLTFDKKLSILIDADPDNENHVYGRDTAIVSINPNFSRFMDDLYDTHRESFIR